MLQEENEIQEENTPSEPVNEEQPGAGNTESGQEQAKVDIITSERKITMSAPVKEYDELKDSFKEFMAAFSNFINATGLEMGRDDTSVKVNALISDFDKLKEDVKAENAKLREDSVPRSEFDEYKDKADARDEQARENYVPRSEFDEYKDKADAREEQARDNYVPRDEFDEYKNTATAREEQAREDYVKRSEFERFRDAIREVI